MTDINFQTGRRRSRASRRLDGATGTFSSGSTAGPAARPARATPERPDHHHLALVELLFFAYRDFTGEADHVLESYGFGRAHHRVLHFVRRNPDLRVADLLQILGVRKQSLNRVLKQLVDEGFIERCTGAADRRERLLKVSPRGAELADRLLALQIARVERALGEMDAEAMAATRRFLLQMVGERDRSAVSSLIAAERHSALQSPQLTASPADRPDHENREDE